MLYQNRQHSAQGLDVTGATKIFATREELAHAQAENAVLRARLDTLEESMPTGDTMLALHPSQQEKQPAELAKLNKKDKNNAALIAVGGDGQK
mgnify:CR=1 FL=1